VFAFSHLGLGAGADTHARFRLLVDACAPQAVLGPDRFVRLDAPIGRGDLADARNLPGWEADALAYLDRADTQAAIAELAARLARGDGDGDPAVP